jgi:hypothetical protein
MTTDRQTSDSSPDLADEFWGDDAEWAPRRPRSAERKRLGSTVGRWWDQLLGGGFDAERTHGGVAESSSDDPSGREPDPDTVDGELDGWIIEPEPRREPRGGVDPLLARFGALAVIVTLASPVVLGFTSSGDESPVAERQTVAVSAVDGSVTGAAPSAITSSTQLPASTESSITVAPTSGSPDAGGPTTTEADPVEPDGESVQPLSEAAVVEQSSELRPAATALAVTAPACGARYEVASGDYWIRLADAAGVPLAELLDVNEATVASVLVPGRSICLPPGARTPTPPPTAAPPVAPAPPSETVAPNRAPSTTAAPAPAAPAPAPSRPAAVSASQAVQAIRDVWPDELEERALEIAWRESNHRSNVNNSCCYGLFQIHWTAHRSWLATLGVTSSTQLFDPLLNATAAYTLYQRAGGFGPWGG